MSFLRRLFDFFASSAPTREMPGPLSPPPDEPRDVWVIPPATGWTFTPLLMIRVPRFRPASGNRSVPARDRTAAVFDRERRLLQRVETDA